MSTTIDLTIADEVRESRARVLEADPGAYSGFATDAAIRAVSARRGLPWRVVLKTYREKYPAATGRRSFIPAGARSPSPEAKSVA